MGGPASAWRGSSTRFFLLPLALLAALGAAAPAAAQTLFGPRQFTLTTATPQTFSALVSTTAGPAHLHVVNGAPDGSARLSHASLTLNGLEVVAPRDLGPEVAVVDVPVVLSSGNLLTVTLTGPVGGTLTLTLERRGTTLLSVTPNRARQGEAVTVTVLGSNTTFTPGSTGLFAGAGIGVGGAPPGTFGPVTVQDPTHLTATLTIAPTARLGPRTLLAKTNGEKAALFLGFTVLAGTPAIAGTTVTTLAGTGTPGLTDGAGTSAQFRFPFAVAAPGNGGGIVADTGNSALRSVQADGTVSTVPLPVPLLLPTGVARDSTGRTIVADTGRCVIRIHNTDGTVTTIGQAGSCGFADGGPTVARFRFPRDATVDGSGNILVADTGNFRVRKIAPDGAVSTLAGTGQFGNTDGPPATATFGLLSGIAALADGRVVVSDAVFHRLRQVAPDGTVSPLAGTGIPGFADGTAGQAQFAFPTGLSRDATGHLYVADTLNQVIRRWTPTGQIETVAGTGALGSQDGPGSQATFTLPAGVGATPGAVLVADTFNHKLRLVRVGPEVTGLTPTTGAQGETLTLTVTGTNFTGATALTFLLNGVADGTITASTLTVNPTGTELTATASIAPTAAIGPRVVTVTTPSGTSSSRASAANTVAVLGTLTLTPRPLTVTVGKSALLTISLFTAAPAGGLPVTLESAGPTIATVTSPATIPAGATRATATVSGLSVGLTNLTVTAPGFAPARPIIEVQPPPLILKITEPAPGATVPAGPLLVRGSLQIRDAGTEVGVTVNGVPAAVQGSTFVALVPVTPEITSLTAVGTTAAGDTASHTIALTVTPAPEPAFTLHVSPGSGVAPLTVAFSLLGTTVPATVALDFDGNSLIDFTGPSLEGQSFVYTAPGVYLPMVTVTDAQGGRFTARAVVQVYDRTALNTLLQAKWTALKDALRGGDIARALTFIAARSRPRYEQAFVGLTTDLPSIDSILTDLTLVRVRGREAIFEMRRTDSGILKSFEVRFIIDTDAIWRLRAF